MRFDAPAQLIVDEACVCVCVCSRAKGNQLRTILAHRTQSASGLITVWRCFVELLQQQIRLPRYISLDCVPVVGRIGAGVGGAGRGMTLIKSQPPHMNAAHKTPFCYIHKIATLTCY